MSSSLSGGRERRCPAPGSYHSAPGSSRRPKGHEPAIGADGRAITLQARRLNIPWAHIHAFGCPRLTIVDEDIDGAIRVIGHEIRRLRREDDVSSIGADGGLVARARCLCSARPHADAVVCALTGATRPLETSMHTTLTRERFRIPE